MDRKCIHMLATLKAALEEDLSPHKVLHQQLLSLDCKLVTMVIKSYHLALQEIEIQCSRHEQVVEPH